MTKGGLIAVSVVRDLLDFTPFGHIPVVDQLLDLPVIYLHYRYAGPKALVGLPEIVPFIGFLPIFTVLAISYGDAD